MAQARKQLDISQQFEMATEAALQRFTRGQSSIGTLHKVLKDYGRLEKKIRQVYNEYLQKWEEKSRTQVGSNLAYDETKVVMRILMATYKEQVELQNKSIDFLYDKNGPIKTLQEYIDSEDVHATRKATQSLYERTNKRQVKLEKDIGLLKEDYFLAKDRMVQFKPEMDAAEYDPEGRTDFRELLGHWRKLESDAEGAKRSYKHKVKEEKATRPTFIEDMKRFQTDSDAYERARLQKVQEVMTSVMRGTKSVEVKRQKVLNPLLEEGSSHLQKYDMQKEVDAFNAFYRYQHQFPKEQPHPSEASAAKKTEDGLFAAKEEQHDEADLVQVLSPRDDSDRLFVKRTIDQDAEKPRASRYSRHVTDTTPKPKAVRFTPEVDIPNFVADRNQTAAPIVTETVLESDKDSSDSDSDEDQSPAADIRDLAQGEKVKAYAIKAFSARSTDEISFKAGRKIYVTESAVAGRLYGYIKKGKLIKKRTYGYFPEQLVSTDKSFKAKKTSLKKKLAKHLPLERSKPLSFAGYSG